MKPEDRVPDRAEDDDRPETDEEITQPGWTPPERSDQAPGEEVVQVNDPYAGGGPPPSRDESNLDDDQHPTGG
jgi:hypothetical protein